MEIEIEKENKDSGEILIEDFKLYGGLKYI